MLALILAATVAAASPTPSPPPSDPCAGYGLLLAALNRPAVGYSTCVAPVGSIILEEGYQSTVQSGTVAVTYPRGFERFGVAPRLEIDAIGPNQDRTSIGGVAQNGLSDLGAGFKYGLISKGAVQWAIDGLFTAATGARAFTSGAPTTQVNADASYSVSSKLGLATTIGLFSTRGYGAVVPSFEVTYATSRSTQAFAEFATQTKIAANAGGASLADYGIQQLLGPSVQIDAEYGTGLTPIAGARYHYVAFGLGLYIK